MKKTIYSEDELSGMIKILIDLFETNNGRISEELGLGFHIKKIDKTYTAIFNWVGEKVLVSISDHDHEPEYDETEFEKDFMIREDESLSKVEQYVTDILFEVKQTEL